MKTPTLYTVTPNPALDVSGHVDRLLVNEKNYVHDERRDPGGNGINAARVARRLGARVLALGFLGGDAGEDIRKRLHEEGVPSAFTPIREHTRINVTVTNDADCKQTRLTFHGPQVRASECANLMSQIRKLHAPGILILGGSMPPGLPANFHGALARRGIARGLGVVVDVPAKLMKSVLGLDLLLLKPNEVELAEFAGRALRSERAIVAAAQGLRAAMVCVSLGARGALLVTARDVFRGHAPKVRARGSVGAGDSMVGAMTAALARAGVTTSAQARAADGEVLCAALAWGLAAGAATAEARGTELGRVSEIRRLHAQVRVEKI